MEPDNLTIAYALRQIGYTRPHQIAKIMAIDLGHARQLIRETDTMVPPVMHAEPAPDIQKALSI